MSGIAIPVENLPKLENREDFAFKYILSCGAATVAEISTYPLDITKTRLQIQGEKASQASSHGGPDIVYKKRGMIKTGVSIVKHEGILKLWQGITPAILRHYVYTGIRMAMYEYIREKVLLQDEDGGFALWKSLVAGTTAGFIGQYFASPTDLFKVRLQMINIKHAKGQGP